MRLFKKYPHYDGFDKKNIQEIEEIFQLNRLKLFFYMIGILSLVSGTALLLVRIFTRDLDQYPYSMFYFMIGAGIFYIVWGYKL